MNALFADLPGYWMPSWRSDPRAVSLYSRHYSHEKNARPGRQLRNCVGPGETMVLLSHDCSAVFVWLHNIIERWDKQTGVCCTLFRNEGQILSSDLIREACDLAWERWPGQRLWTYVWPAKIRSTNPGACFKKAGWRTCGRNADGRLTILEIYPPTVPARPPAVRTEPAATHTRGGRPCASSFGCNADHRAGGPSPDAASGTRARTPGWHIALADVSRPSTSIVAANTKRPAARG